MRFYAATLFVGLFSLPSKALAAVDCDDNVKISNADDAREVAEKCRVIVGKLDLSDDLAEDVNIENLEEIKGGLTLNGACGGGCSDPEKGRFNISMPNLTAVGGPLIINDAPNLVNLLLPKLETIRGPLKIRNPTTTLIDITDLKFVESLLLDTPKLKNLSLSGLEGPHNESLVNFHVSLINVGQIESLDGIFKNPIDPIRTNETDFYESLYLNAMSVPHIKNLTFGWKYIHRIEVTIPDFTLIFGGPKSKQVYMDQFLLTNGNIKRSETLERLGVKSFNVESGDREKLHLDMEFLSQLRVTNVNKALSITNSPTAESWEDFVLIVEGPNIPQFPSQPKDSGDRKWHWPEPVEYIGFNGDVDQEFVMDILNKVNITDEFAIFDTSGDLDCQALTKKAQSKVIRETPSRKFLMEFNCDPKFKDNGKERDDDAPGDEGGASSLGGVSLIMQLTLAGLIASILCF